MDDKFIQALHSELSSSYELGTVEEFGKKLASDDVFRKALFEDASKTLDLGDYATFEGQVKKKLSTEFPLPSIENLQKDFQKRQQESGDFSVVPQPDKPEEKRQTSVAGDLLRTLKSTSLRALGGIAAVPNLGDKTIDRLVLYPIAKAMSPGATDEAIETGLSVMQMASPGGGQLETLAQYGATAQDKLSKVAVRTDAKMKQIEGGIIKNFKEGNVGEAFEQLARGVVGTIPYLAEVAATAGGGAAAVLSTIGATAASQQYGEIKGREDLSGGGKILNSWLYGGFEAAGELVTAGILNRTFRALRGAGVQPTKEVTENLAKSLLRKFGIIGKEGGSEAVSEMVTQVGQNLTAMWTGEDTERKWHDGALDAGLIGFFPGAGMGTIQAAVAGRAIATKEEVDAVNESHAKQAAIIEQIEAAENIETKEVLEQELIAEKDNEQSVIEANIEVARTMTEEQLAEVSKLQTARAELDAKISDPALPKEERANIESISKGIDEQIIEIREATPKVDNGASNIAPRIEGKTESGTQVSPEGDMPAPTSYIEPTEEKKEADITPVKRISEPRTLSHTKGVFMDDAGALYKSTEGKAGETMEHEVISQNSDLSFMPAVGDVLNTSEGRAFEIERLSPLDEADNITLDEYRAIVTDARKLDERGVFVSESPDLGRNKEGTIKLFDFSMSRNKAKAEKGDANYSSEALIASAAYDHLSQNDKNVVDYENEIKRKNKLNKITKKDTPVETKGFLYSLTARPFSKGTFPEDGFVTLVSENDKKKDGSFGVMEFKRPLSQREVDKYELRFDGRSENSYPAPQTREEVSETTNVGEGTIAETAKIAPQKENLPEKSTFNFDTEEMVIGKDLVDDIKAVEDAAKTMSADDFSNFYLSVTAKIWDEGGRKTTERSRAFDMYFRSLLPEGELAGSKSIREAILGTIGKRQIVKTNNISVKALNGDVVDKIDDKGRAILEELVSFTEKKYPSKKLGVSIGAQPISVAGSDGFRMTIPNVDSPISDMFPYDAKLVIPAYEELERRGADRRTLWAAHDWFHEMAHTEGIENEKEADAFAVKHVQEFIASRAETAQVEARYNSAPEIQSALEAMDIVRENEGEVPLSEGLYRALSEELSKEKEAEYLSAVTAPKIKQQLSDFDKNDRDNTIDTDIESFGYRIYFGISKGRKKGTYNITDNYPEGQGFYAKQKSISDATIDDVVKFVQERMRAHASRGSWVMSSKIVSKKYIRAKEDGGNPALVAEVDKLLKITSQENKATPLKSRRLKKSDFDGMNESSLNGLGQDNQDAIDFLNEYPHNFIGITESEGGADRITGVTRQGGAKIERGSGFALQLNFKNDRTKVMHFKSQEALNAAVDKIYKFVGESVQKPEMSTEREQEVKVEQNKESSHKKEEGFSYDVNWYDIKNQQGDIVGNIVLLDRGDYYQVQNAKVETPRKGIGLAAYKQLITQLDKPLYSDTSMTQPAHGLWNKLVAEGLAEQFKENIGSEKKPNIISRYRTITPEAKEVVPPPVEPTEPTVEQPEGGKRSGFEERSVENRTDEVGKAVKKIIDDNPHFYKELHQEDAIKQAQDLISSFGSIDNAYEDLLKKTTVLEDLPIRHVARQILMQHYAGELRTALGQNNQSAADALSNKIVKIDEILVKEVTLSGQTSAMTMWRLLNPEASVFMVQKLFNEINRTKLGFEAKQAEDFIDKWDKEVPDVVKRLLTENQELRKQIEEIRSKTGVIPVKRLPKEKAKDWAAAVRALKSSNRGMAFADPIGAVAIIDGALEVTARTIETTGNVIQAIQEGIAVIRASKWYKSLTKAQQKDAEKKFSDDIRSGMPDFDAAEYMEGRSWFKPVPTEEEVAAKAEKKATAKAKRDADKKLQEQIYDIIASHWLVGKDTQQTLVDRLMEELGLTRGEATKIAGVAEAAVEADAKRVFDTTLGKKIPNKQMRKSAFDKFFALIKRGVLSNDNYYEVFAEKHKLKKGLTPEEKEELQRLSVQADIMKPYGYFGEMAYAEFMQYMGKVTEADSWVTRQSKLIISANYARMLSGITTHKVNITSSGANLLITPLLGINPVHLHNWAKVIDAIARGDKAKLKLSNPLIPIWYAFASYPAGSGVGFTEAKNIIRHGNIKMASKYMESVNNLGGTAIPELEKNKFGAGKRFRPLNIPLPKGKKFDANPWNAMKYSGRTLLAEDAFMFNTAFAQELALAARRAEITEGTKLSEKELRTKLINEIAGRFLTKEQSDAIENQIEEQVTMLRNGGIEPTPNQIRQRRFELTRSLLDLSQERIEEATQMARGEIFTDMRGGVFSQFGDFLGRIFGKNVLIKLGTMPKIPFTGVLGRVADMAIDTAPGYGLLRAYGWSPTGIIARGQQWHRTGSARDFFVAPAKYGLFRSAQLGEKGSARFERQLARAYFGVFSVAIAAAVFLGSDDDNLDEDGHPKIDITGGLAFADIYEKEQHYLGPYTIKIGKFKLRYLNYPIMNMPLAIIGNYKDHLRAGKDPDDALATLMLTAEAYWHSLFMVKDTWLAKGINDLVELVGGAINSIGGSESKEKLKDEEQMKILDPRVTRQMETMKDDYTGLVFKYVSPLRSNMVQQIVRFSAPEGRLKGKNTDLLMYNLGLQWITNDKRTDIFGQTIKTLPGDQGIAWPREDDDRWAKMWEYNIHLTDIRASDKLIIDGLPQTLEWDQYIERKKRTSELFKERFDKYFAETPKEVLEKKATTFTTDPRTRVMNNYVHEDISSIWSRTKEDVERSMFVWGNQSKAEPKLFDFLTKNSAIPDFYNKKFKVDPSGYLMVATSDDAPEDLLILPYPVLRKINDTAMDGFIKAAKDWMGEEYVEEKDFYKKRMQAEWGYQLDYVILDKNAELLEAVREMANDRE